MAICKRCKREMMEGHGCSAGEYVARDGAIVAPIAFGSETREMRGFAHGPDGACHDCGVTVGGLHHLDCDLEECPACGSQRLSCEGRGCRLAWRPAGGLH